VLKSPPALFRNGPGVTIHDHPGAFFVTPIGGFEVSARFLANWSLAWIET
jgi:hypothetical protein